MKKGLAKIIWETGSSLRNPHLDLHYRELKKTESISLNSLRELQFKRVKEILIHAFKNSIYYNKVFLNYSFDPESDFQSLDDLKKIPTISKEELIKYNNQIHATDFKDKVFPSETSGSTGQSLKFRKDENWDSFNRAARVRGFSWHDVNPWDRNGYMWGYNFSRSAKIESALLDLIQNRFRIFSYRDDEIMRFAEKLREADYICGYSSMIYEVARIINENAISLKPLKLKMVCGTSEKIYESYQSDAIKAFGRRIIGEYGAAEAGIIAFECASGSLHINMEGVYVEEEDGEIIITNLIARSFPIIRYKLGDFIKLKDPGYECPCGMKHRVIENVLGRVGKLVYGRERTYPSLTFYYVFKNLALNQNIDLNYRADQIKKGEIILNIEQQLKPYERSLLEKELMKYFNNDISFEVHSGRPIHRMQGKFMDFVSHIDS